MNLKKTIAIGLAATALFASFGCGSGEKKSSGLPIVSDIVLEQTSKGHILYRQGKYSEAIACFTKAINENDNPYYRQPYWLRGDAFRAQGNYEAAIADYMKVINDGNKVIDKYPPGAPNDFVNPRSGMGFAYRGLGYMRVEQNELHGAIDYFTKAIEVDPNCVAYKDRGEVYQQLGDEEKAKADFAKAQKLITDYENSAKRRKENKK